MKKIENKFNKKIYKINRDINGNPRYIIKFKELGLNRFKSTNKTNEAGLKKYKSEKHWGYFVFQSFNIDLELKKIFNILKK